MPVGIFNPMKLQDYLRLYLQSRPGDVHLALFVNRVANPPAVLAGTRHLRVLQPVAGMDAVRGAAGTVGSTCLPIGNERNFLGTKVPMYIRVTFF